MARLLALVAFFLFPLLAQSQSRDPSQGTIANLVFSLSFGNTPGTDQLTANGTYAQAPDSPAFNFAADTVTVSLDNGRWTQVIPAGSFVAISGGWRFTSTEPGVQQLKIMNNGTWNVIVRKIDATGMNGSRMGAFSFGVGENLFTAIPNSAPLGKVSGPASGAVGDLLTFDASSSTDFNSDALSFAWSVVTAPLGSESALSSANQATTSFTPDLAGAYVLKVMPSDAAGAGVPALVTVNVTGGSVAPPPAPGPDNGLIVLNSDLNSYIVGQTATFTLHVNVPDGNGARRYAFLATYDDQPVTLTTVANQVDYSFVTPAFTDVGTHTLKVLQYTETADYANDLELAIKAYNADITACNKALLYETSPDEIARLQAQIADDQARIAIVEQQLEENRTQVAGPALLTISVN
jgi:hypothetical protein